MVKSNGGLEKDKALKPNRTLNQHFKKPIRPKTFAVTISMTNESPPSSNKPEKIINSLENLSVPGNPEKKRHIKNTQLPKLGVICIIPESSTT